MFVRRSIRGVVVVAALAFVLSAPAPAGAQEVGALCTATSDALRSSPAYLAMSEAEQRRWDRRAFSTCVAVQHAAPHLSDTQLTALIDNYQGFVETLAAQGIITPQQASALEAQAEAIVNPVVITGWEQAIPGVWPENHIGCGANGIRIHGSGFTGATEVLFNGHPAAWFGHDFFTPDSIIQAAANPMRAPASSPS